MEVVYILLLGAWLLLPFALIPLLVVKSAKIRELQGIIDLDLDKLEPAGPAPRAPKRTDAKYCPHCGVKISLEPPAFERKDVVDFDVIEDNAAPDYVIADDVIVDNVIANNIIANNVAADNVIAGDPAKNIATEYISAEDAAAAIIINNDSDDLYPDEEKRSVNPVNVVMIIGAAFIILSGVIFASAAWNFLNNAFRAVVVLSFSALFFVFSAVAERKLKLPKAGVVLYTIGSFFLPTTLVSVGYFKLFGDWFSLSGGGMYLLLTMIFGILSIVLFRGAASYINKSFAWGALLSLSLSVASALLYFTDGNYGAFALGTALYSFLFMLLCKPVLKINTKKFGAIRSVLLDFAAVNSALFSLFTLFSFGFDGMTFAAYMIFASAFLHSVYVSKNGFAGAVPFTVFVATGLYRLVNPDTVGGVSFVSSAISLTVVIMSLMGGIGGTLQKVFKTINVIVLVPAVAIGAVGSFFSNAAGPMMAVSVAVLAANTAFILVRANRWRFRFTDRGAVVAGADGDPPVIVERGNPLCGLFALQLILLTNICARIFIEGDSPQIFATGALIMAFAVTLKLLGRNVFGGAFSSIVFAIGLGAVAVIMLMNDWGGGYTVVFIGLLAVYCMGDAFAKARLWNRPCFIAGLLFAMLTAYLIPNRLFAGTLTSYELEIVCLCGSALAAVAALFVRAYKTGFRFDKEAQYVGHISLSIFALMAALLFVYAPGWIHWAYAAPYAAMLAFALLFAYRDKYMIPVIFPLLAICWVIMAFRHNSVSHGLADGWLSFVIALVFTISMIISRVAHKKIFDGGRVDVLTLSSWPCLFYLAATHDIHSVAANRNEYWAWSAWIFAGFYLLNFIGRVGTDRARKPLITAASVLAVFAWCLQPFFTIPERFVLEFCIVGCILFFYGMRLLWKNTFANILFHLALAVTAFTEAILFINNAPHGRLPWHHAVEYAAALAVALFFAYRERFTILATLSLAMLFPVMYAMFNQADGLTNGVDYFIPLSALGLMVSMTVSRIAHKKVADGHRYVDAPAVAALPALYYIMMSVNIYWSWSAWIFISLYLLNFIDRLKIGAARLPLITAASVCAALAWCLQPFFAIPARFHTEYTAVGAALFCLGMRLVWKDRRDTVDWFAFIVAAVYIVILCAEAAGGEHIFDTLIVLTSVLTMLLTALKRKRKKWFLLSVVPTLFMTLFMSKAFWSAMLWWGYLTATGAAFIATGIRAEAKRRNAEDGASAAKRILADWEW